MTYLKFDGKNGTLASTNLDVWICIKYIEIYLTVAALMWFTFVLSHH